MKTGLMRRAAGFVAAVGVVLGARADIVYDNTQNYQGMFLASTNEYGDEITLAGTARLLTAFLFDYFGDFTPDGDEMVRVRLYAQDGPIFYKDYRMPGTQLYDSGFLPISNDTNGNNMRLLIPRLEVPDTLTYTVQFVGLRQVPGDWAGLLFCDPATVGAQLPPYKGKPMIGSYPDFWQRTGGSWDLYTYEYSDPTHPPANFSVQLIAVPEPSTIALGAVAAAGWLTCRAMRRRRDAR